jgi:hypothetical protein
VASFKRPYWQSECVRSFKNLKCMRMFYLLVHTETFWGATKTFVLEINAEKAVC